MGWPQRAELAAEVFGNMPVSLIGFQEFGRRWVEEGRVKGVDSWNALGSAHPEMYVYRGEDAGDIHINPIAYENRFTALSSGTEWISEDGSRKDGWDGALRGFSWVLFHDNGTDREDHPLDRQVLMVNVHLDNRGMLARMHGVRLILEFINTHFPNVSVIITGDLNMSTVPMDRWGDKGDEANGIPPRKWDEAEMQAPYLQLIDAGFTDCWRSNHMGDPDRPETWPTPPNTFHNFQGEDFSRDPFGLWNPDMIFVRGFKVIKTTLVRDNKGGVWPSDHYWLQTLLDYE
jgi:hypothetical protein